MRFIGLVLIILAFVWVYKLKPQGQVQSNVEVVNQVEILPQSFIQKRSQPVPRPQKFLTTYSQEPEDIHLDIYPDLEDELFVILQQLDPEHAEHIFKQYKDEKRKHSEELSLSLNLGVMNLSMLNGESIDDEQIEERIQHSSNLTMLEINHQKRIKIILGDHFEYIHDQLSAQNYR